MTSTTDAATPRPRTDVDRIADAFLDATVELSPTAATYMGIPGHDEDLDDFSPAGHAAHSALRRRTLAALAQASPVDDIDRVTVSAMQERLTLSEEIHAAGLDEMSLDVIASPIQGIRSVFDLMPTDTAEQWAVIATRMSKVPRALEQYVESLTAAAARGNVSPRRQVEACIGQCEEFTADDGYFATLVREARAGGQELDAATATALAEAVSAASDAYAALGQTLRREILPQAPESDACGRERYQLVSRSFLGTAVDLEETYAWGQAELARITAEMEAVAEQIKPGATVTEAIEMLDADPAYQLHGTDELRAWMQGKADEAIASLAGSHFDIPEPVRRIECMIAPTDLGRHLLHRAQRGLQPSRPDVVGGAQGRHRVRHLAGADHRLPRGRPGTPPPGRPDGLPLRAAQPLAPPRVLGLRPRRGLGALRRAADGRPGLHGRPGQPDGPARRAVAAGRPRRARHRRSTAASRRPPRWAAATWTYDKAWQFLSAHANMAEGFLRFELDRYLGWPGQAPSYKIGERLWLQLRDEVRAREGDAFDLKAFHRRALDIGGVGLDTLRTAVLG